MNDFITVSINFYFKGEKITSKMSFDLEPLLHSKGELPDFYPLLAKNIKLDFYSYEYEMMQVEQVVFSSENKLIKDFICDGHFDFNEFKKSWLANKVMIKLQEIALEYCGVENLELESQLKVALLNAYKLGLNQV